MPKPPVTKVLVSACLLGRECRYDGAHNHDLQLERELRERDEVAVPFCPEEAAGMSTPRTPIYIESESAAAVLEGRDRIVTEKGEDVTPAVRRGAELTLAECRAHGIERAYLKERSPSCGVSCTHVDAAPVPGPGLTAALLAREGIEIVGVEGRRALSTEERGGMEPDREGAFLELLELHTKVNGEVRRLGERHRQRLRCGRGCSACCIDELTVFVVEAERIRREFPFVLTEPPHPAGACAFLDAEGACRVYAARPFVCRTQGLPLLWFDEDEAEEIEEHRQICELNLEGEALETLDFDELWVLGPNEQRLSRLQEHYSGGGQERVALRGLFEGSAE